MSEQDNTESDIDFPLVAFNRVSIEDRTEQVQSNSFHHYEEIVELGKVIIDMTKVVALSQRDVGTENDEVKTTTIHLGGGHFHVSDPFDEVKEHLVRANNFYKG